MRIVEDEMIVGAATLLEAPHHMVPLINISSVSHTTSDFYKVLKMGYNGIRDEINNRLSQNNIDDGGKDLLLSMIKVLDAADIWHKRYLDEIKRLSLEVDQSKRGFYEDLYKSLENVPNNPPSNFREAVQSLWFAYCFQRLMGNWLGLGRLDVMLNPYLEADLKKKSITLDEAREILAHFWIKGCEWIGENQIGSGDAQFYQNVILSGIDRNGKDVTNNVTYLVLDIVEELHISDFPIAVRVN